MSRFDGNFCSRMTENEIMDEIDKLRRENGWKPRRRFSHNKANSSVGDFAKNDAGKTSNHHDQQETLLQQQVKERFSTDSINMNCLWSEQ